MQWNEVNKKTKTAWKCLWEKKTFCVVLCLLKDESLLFVHHCLTNCVLKIQQQDNKSRKKVNKPLILCIPVCMLPEWHNMDSYTLLSLANIPHESSQICLPDTFNLQFFQVSGLQTWGVIWDRMKSENTGMESGWDFIELHGAQLLCPCLVLISLERQRWPCWVKTSTSRAAGLDSWPWSGRWEVTREVGVGSVYVGLQRASRKGNTSMRVHLSWAIEKEW